ncbi:MAG: hypothetical protein QM811_09010 [Pirellulales bacterium]
MMQGLGLDGRVVRRIELSAYVRAKDVKVGTEREQLPQVGVLFFDENRTQVGINWIGPFRGDVDWTLEKQKFDVPPQTREAIVTMGLYGATGRFDLDQVQLRAVDRNER